VGLKQVHKNKKQKGKKEFNLEAWQKEASNTLS